MNFKITQHSLKEILNQYTTPLYIYSKTAIASRVQEIKDSFPIDNFELLFATMANDNYEFINTLKDCDVGACINSIKHLEKVVECGIPTNKIQFTSTGISKNDLKLLYEKEITVNFDSYTQIKNWFNLAPNLKAGVRINTASLIPNSKYSDRLGNHKDELQNILKLAKTFNGTINGLHIYIGTNFKNHEDMLPYLIAFIELATYIPSLEYINIGGGIGIQYSHCESVFDLKKYGSAVAELMRQLNLILGRNIKLVFEPGRGLAGSTGIYITKVCDIKSLNNIKYIVVDGSIASFPRPFHHPESPHPTYLPFKINETSNTESVIVGRTTFSKDILSKSLLPENIVEGDFIIFEQAGAYCDSMRSKFLGQTEPPNVFI